MPRPDQGHKLRGTHPACQAAMVTPCATSPMTATAWLRRSGSFLAVAALFALFQPQF